MASLFEEYDQPVVPEIPGFTYRPHFITEQEERELLVKIDQMPWSHEFERRRQHYGGSYGGAQRVEEIPAWLAVLGRRLVENGLFSEEPEHALVNEYLPGQGISAHKDYDPFEDVASISLGSGATMDFVRLSDGRKESLWLEPRSVVVLTGEARHGWTHGIARRKSDLVQGAKVSRGRRVSITFRTLRQVDAPNTGSSRRAISK